MELINLNAESSAKAPGESSPINQNNLTFGVEFEFALATRNRVTTDPDPDPSDPRPLQEYSGRIHNWDDVELQDHIANVLSNAGLPARVLIGAGKNYDNKWTVGYDTSVQGPDVPVEVAHYASSHGYKWFPAEIGSPPYIYSPTSLEAIKHFCATLTSNFRCNVNASTGLHVHVGSGDAGFDIDTIRNLMIFLWTFEGQLDQLHPNRLADTMHSTCYYQSPRRESLLANRLYTSPAPHSTEALLNEDPILTHLYEEWRKKIKRKISIREGLLEIAKCESVDEIVRLTADEYGEHMAVNLRFLMSGSATSKRTIEFRQHEGCLDDEVVTNWVKVCVGLVVFAQDVDSDALLEFCLDHARIEDNGGEVFDVTELLKVIGLGEQADFYEGEFVKAPGRSPKGRMERPTPYIGEEERMKRGYGNVIR
jgi:hypothetical protein